MEEAVRCLRAILQVRSLFRIAAWQKMVIIYLTQVNRAKTAIPQLFEEDGLQ